MKKVLFAIAALAAMSAQAQFSTIAVDNATVQPTGPRSGSNGKRFFNVEGNDNGQFASFGVIDFDSQALGINFTVGDITGIRLKLVHAPAGFSRTGTVSAYVTEDVATDIQPGTSPLIWDVNSLPEGLGGQLAPNYKVADNLPYDQTLADLFVFDYTLTLTPAAEQYLINQINARGRVRLIVTPNENGCAATYSGYTRTDINGTPVPPVLEVDATEGSSEEDVLPTSYSVTRGVEQGANDVTKLLADDNSYAVVQQRFQASPTVANAELQAVLGVTGAVNSARLDVNIKANSFPLGDATCRQDIALRDWNTNAFVVVDTRKPENPSGTEALVSVTLDAAQRARFIRSSDGRVEVATRVYHLSPLSPAWVMSVDRIRLVVTR